MLITSVSNKKTHFFLRPGVCVLRALGRLILLAVVLRGSQSSHESLVPQSTTLAGGLKQRNLLGSALPLALVPRLGRLVWHLSLV